MVDDCFTARTGGKQANPHLTATLLLCPALGCPPGRATCAKYGENHEESEDQEDDARCFPMEAANPKVAVPVLADAWRLTSECWQRRRDHACSCSDCAVRLGASPGAGRKAG